jgi:hypothetical protein
MSQQRITGLYPKKPAVVAVHVGYRHISSEHLSGQGSRGPLRPEVDEPGRVTVSWAQQQTDTEGAMQ